MTMNSFVQLGQQHESQQGPTTSGRYSKILHCSLKDNTWTLAREDAFVVRAPVSWNWLLEDVKSVETLESFKQDLLAYITMSE